ncbi:DUF3488 and transglutaminase-like domain-containing protein [Stieleria sp. TO1_6]|nr:DUF3488 and transglutaminase-like domain-containing protein [Stieleria tagensis]
MESELMRLPAVRLRLEFQFALLSAAGGMVLASGQGTEGIALLAIFMAAFGFVFVDWLRVFELPPIGAYLAMGGAAAYCVRDFWGLQMRGEPQMISVALLLVLVQGVLMMQHKSRRILEQLAVFCLLELVVAAIFNDAINFGLLMIPIALIGGSALSLLGLVAIMEHINVTDAPQVAATPTTRIGRLLRMLAGQTDQDLQQQGMVRMTSPESALALYRSARPWSRFAVLTLTPAVLLVATAFFYVLPRKVDAARGRSGGPALVGFDDKIQLEQLGQVMQNPKTALKVELTDASTGQPYQIADSLYLRGKVLEHYEVNFAGHRPVARWVSLDRPSLNQRQRPLPPAYQPRRSSHLNSYDDVHVKLTCESMSRPALFSIAPYYASGDAFDVIHAAGDWTLARASSAPPFPKLRYEFGTHAFHRGVQTGWIAHQPEMRRMSSPNGMNLRSFFAPPPTALRPNYMQDLLQFDRLRVPTAARLAEQVLDDLGLKQRSPVKIARAMESFLATDPRFHYTLKLDATPIDNVDPIEQFLAVDHRGHCQYFASALALMLRSVGIPCRLVVGYRTEEFNRIGGYYIARQQHAHSWVEALIDARELPDRSVVAGQRPSDRYWIRLDPTPGVSELDDGNNTGVDGLMDMANNIWEDYVVEMDAERQSEELVQATGLGDVQTSYRSLFERLEQKLAEIRSGRLGGGSMSLRDQLPLRMIAAVIGGILVLVLLSQIRFRKWFSFARTPHTKLVRQQPTLDFYRETLRQLERVGIERQADETPAELCRRAESSYPILAELTTAFQQQRYGSFASNDAEHLRSALDGLTADVDQQLASGSVHPSENY